MKFLWKIGGEAGFGILTTGVTFSKMATRCGFHIFDYAEYPSLIKGGHNTYEVLVSDQEVFSTQTPIDLLVCLNEETYHQHKHRLSASSCVVYDPAEFEFEADVAKIQVPIGAFLKELVGPRLMSNIIALGVSLALLDGDIAILEELIVEEFGRKGEEVVDYNKRFAKRGFDHIREHYGHLVKPVFKKKSDTAKLVMTGNDTFSLGAVAADCRFYCAYPMSPSSSILSTLAAWAPKTGMVVRHAEDEISVINTALGASSAGVRAAVGTSGGGFALMVEAISFAGVAEIPVVIFLGQRPGPATGLPTWTEQGDLLFATFAGHGEFPKIVLAPGDTYEMLELSAAAFDLADIYQTPVIVLSDKFLAESHKSEDAKKVQDFLSQHNTDRGKTIEAAHKKPYLRYEITDDGISPRLIPGAPGHYYQTNSYEHAPDSHTTEESEERRQQVDKRNRKAATYLKNHFEGPRYSGDKTASNVLVTWGAMKGPAMEAQKMLAEEGVAVGLLHFTHIFPMDRKKVAERFDSSKRYVLVENNSLGQFGKLLAMECGLNFDDKLLKYDGRPFFPEEVVEYVKSL